MSRFEPETLLVELRKTRIVNRSLTTCDRCGARARWTTNRGMLCCACASILGRQADRTLRELAQGYGLVIGEEDCDTEILHSLAQYGEVTLRSSSNPTCSQMHYHPLPERAVAELELPDINRQALAVARILWGCALAVGADLRDWPRDAAYPPEEIEPYAEVICWALYSRSRLAWLLTYAIYLDDAHRTRPRKRAGRLVSPSGTPHSSLDGVPQWWAAAFRDPHVRRQVAVLRETGCDWPPVRNHPATRLAG